MKMTLHISINKVPLLSRLDQTKKKEEKNWKENYFLQRISKEKNNNFILSVKEKKLEVYKCCLRK